MSACPEARAAIRDAVERGLTGQWRSQSGYVIDTLEAAVAASLAPTYLEGILPVVARGDDSDTVAAIAGAVLGARGLLPPDELIDGLRCHFRWPTWPPGETLGWPTLAAFVPPRSDREAPLPTDSDPEAEAIGYVMPILRSFTWDEIAPGVHAGRAPIFRRDVWRLQRVGSPTSWTCARIRSGTDPAVRGGSAIAEIDVLGMSRLCVAVTGHGHAERPSPGRGGGVHGCGAPPGRLGVRPLSGGCPADGGYRGGLVRASAALLDRRGRQRLRERRPDFEPMVFQVAAARSWLSQQKAGLSPLLRRDVDLLMGDGRPRRDESHVARDFGQVALDGLGQDAGWGVDAEDGLTGSRDDPVRWSGPYSTLEITPTWSWMYMSSACIVWSRPPMPTYCSPPRATSTDRSPSIMARSCPAVRSLLPSSAANIARTSAPLLRSGLPLSTTDSYCNWT